MSAAACQKGAKQVESGLKGKLFLGGDLPSKEDIEKFHEMLGKDNLYLHRWVRHMATFAADERKGWKGTAAKGATVASVQGGPAKAKPAAPKEGLSKPKTKSEVVVEIHQKKGADMKKLEEYIRQIRHEGLDFGSFTPAPYGLTWKCVLEDAKVSKQDLTDMTVGFAKFVERVNFASWTPWHEPGDDDEM
eukprot:TRINITY_DN6186_c0_g1_i1.p1 TRINITY_DN6186_c0_g1~~TRINITY_DN6186_c0_g1_i1.p1  ORF type:complete len:216 (+),score=102.81 TRINITY_DN6186_c0_g1_i1:80-649(+)